MSRCPLCTHYKDNAAYWQQIAAIERQRAEKAEARVRQLQEALFRIWAKAEPVKEGRLAG